MLLEKSREPATDPTVFEIVAKGPRYQPSRLRVRTIDDLMKSSANRTWTVLRAALNHAFREELVASDAAWRKVESFKGVDAARVRYLPVEQARRLVNTSEPDFRLLVQAALQTGCRYSELARLEVADFNPDSGTVAVRRSKSGKARHVVLTDEGVLFFRQLAAGHASSEIMLCKANGEAWRASHLRPRALKVSS